MIELKEYCDCSDIKNILAGIVTLYYPKLEYLNNIRTYAEYLGTIYIVDNTPDSNEEFKAELSAAIPHAKYVSEMKNHGVAHALNLGLAAARKDGYLWLLTMDQDSSFTPDHAARYFASINNQFNENVAVLSPCHSEPLEDNGPCVYVEKDIVWTSGNMVDVNKAETIGGFDEKLFIDSVDHEYCLRAKLKGYRILQSRNCFMTHEVGDERLVGFMKRKKRSFHSPKRMYFMIRNTFYISEIYGDGFVKFFKKHKKELLKEYIRSIKYSSQRSAYFFYAIKAFVDYKKGVYGNTVGL